MVRIVLQELSQVESTFRGLVASMLSWCGILYAW